MQRFQGLTSNYHTLLNEQYIIGFVDDIPNSNEGV